MAIVSREEIVKKLQSGYCDVVFKKINGDNRVMYCTLMPTFVILAAKRQPKIYDYNTTGRAIESKDYVVVYDLDLRDWRSFRVENVISIEQRKEEE